MLCISQEFLLNAVTLVWPKADTVVKESLVNEIYSKLNVQEKQLITVTSDPKMKADHFFP
ncbi:MAG: hypothetical protein LW875_04475 [Proteobacteria bacterium]|nr:hypothetical protein [Pseudomonadota bacterium]